MKLTKKAQKEYEQLSKKFKISKAEYAHYYNEVRKSRSKASRLSKGHSLRSPKFSLNVDKITTRAEFEERRKHIKETLDRDYYKKANRQQRNNLYHNIREHFGNNKATKDLIKDLDKMSNEELQLFFESNEDIDRILYDSDTEILNVIDETLTKFQTRVDIFNQYGF